MTYIIYIIASGIILAHGATLDIQNDNVTCGEYSFKGLKQAKVQYATVETWVEGAENISELGTLTPIEADDAMADYEKWTLREKIMMKLLVKEINKLRVKNGDSAYTVEQIKTALKEEMQ